MSDNNRKPLWLAGLMAAALSAAANTILYLVELATGAIPWSMLSPGTAFPLSLQRVILVSVAGALAGTVIYWGLERIVNRPAGIFRIIAAAGLLVSLIFPFRIPTATTYMSAAIGLMHAVAAASTVWALTIWAPASRREDAGRII